MTPTVAGLALVAAENSAEGQPPVWLTLAVIALILLGGYAATRTTGTAGSDREGSARPPGPETLGHPPRPHRPGLTTEHRRSRTAPRWSSPWSWSAVTLQHAAHTPIARRQDTYTRMTGEIRSDTFTDPADPENLPPHRVPSAARSRAATTFSSPRPAPVPRPRLARPRVPEPPRPSRPPRTPAAFPPGC
ncbi:hypothetical protein SIM91_04140 [Rhodococcus opacus]|uniref:hypothetical protein n=1 Tax=Rhodococcus opacus TaxID=37919 RepID=UPI000AC63AD8|nr:hypothetical protein [Rhodococcus opacus]MDX5962526.1 hypothetical protein [Rhodococcus opacus]CAG7640738.1 hypothetical protein E143388_08221 [Rhodococcus opacus]